MIGGTLDRILTLPGWLVIALVFLLPALEASAFVGFVFPGEIVVFLGGVSAWRGTVPLWGVIVAAVLGAIIGDSVGYLIGRRWGRGMLQGTIGRLPLIRRHLDEHLDEAQAYVRRRQGSAVFFGRFTTALRVLVPGLAGMSDVHYPTFLLYNVAGGVVWGAGFALLGYVAGASYRDIARLVGQSGLALLALIVLALVLGRVIRRLELRSSGLRALGERAAASPPLAWVRRRFPVQVRWLRRRLDVSSRRGFALTFSLAVSALFLWWFGGLTQDVVAHDDTYLADPHVLSWVVAQRTEALTTFFRTVTWMGSTAVLYPALVMFAALLWWRRREWRPSVLLAAALLGAVALYDIVKPIVGRARPPEQFWIGTFSGWSFPSGHSAQSIAFYGMLAFLLSRSRSSRVRAWLWCGALLVTLIVGGSRIYLGAHWMTDVLGGYALGGFWVSLVIAFTFWREWLWKGSRTGPPDRSPTPSEREPVGAMDGWGSG
ncbi:MAG TPA: bifunctional DedA family/phosphatase PAP2 family protein [Actinomycetota bacterium]|nr:bifunctional DedA family/phosphatase PAP2 family protein [Actinomycetota bacterium]